MKLFLFDLDGTLVTTGGAGLRALGRAFSDLFGVRNAVEKINPSGKTDPAIFREMVKIHLGRDIEHHEFQTMSDAYLRYLEEEMKGSHKKGPLTGVVEFLEHLSPRKDILMALGTGNLEKGARIKLGPMNLNSYFSFGGFGSDSEERSEVLQFGRRRAEDLIGRALDPSSIFVIGDTTLDVAAARKAGFRAVGVASGSVSLEQLASASPDFLWPDMRSGFEFLTTLDGV